MKNSSIVLAAVMLFAAVLRALRVHVRWDEIALAYAAYAEPLVVAVQDGHPSALLGSWVGLHPPAWGVLQALMEAALPVPWVFMGMSALFSLGAVLLVGRTGGLAAALVLATAPVHLLDSAEVNNYPMAAFAVAALMVTARGSWFALAVAAVFAAWSHLLAGLAAAVVVAWRLTTLRPIHARLLALVTGLGLMPIAGGAMRLMGQGSTWSQPEVNWQAWGDIAIATVGAEGLLLAPIVLYGLRGHLRWAWLAMAGGLVLLVALGAAAPHQRPYYGLIAPIAALAVGHSVTRHPQLLWLVMLLTVSRGVRFGADDADRIRAIGADLERTRAVDVALSEASPGDAVWLVSPALQTDDDKTAYSAVLWRFRPWESAPIVRPVPFEYKDYRYGQPRTIRGLQVHSSTELEAATFDHIAAEATAREATIWVVLYDHAPATGMTERIARVMQPYRTTWRDVGSDIGLGTDQLIRVDGLR